MNKKMIELVKQLRKDTGAGVMECKKALEKAKSDIKKAKKILQKQGMIKAKKKSERETNQGYVATYTHANGRVGVMVKILCESDFVAKNAEFQRFARDLCLQVAAMSPKNVKQLLSQDFIKDAEFTIDELVNSVIAKFGENIKIDKIERFEI